MCLLVELTLRFRRARLPMQSSRRYCSDLHNWHNLLKTTILAGLTCKLATVLPLEKHQIDATAKRIISAPLYTAVMSIKLPLNEMTVQEKLAAMESLWEDLSRSPEAIESPAWHKGVLDQRQQRIADGTAQFEDWEKAKGIIREKLR